MNLRKSAIFTVALLILTTTSVNSFAESKSDSDQKGANNANVWSEEKNPTDFWAKPNKNVSNSQDQKDLENQSPKYSGLSVVPAEVFSARNTATATCISTSCGSGDLTNHGGSMLPTVTIYSIYWGSATVLSNNYKNNTDNFLKGLVCASASCNTTLTNTLQQYWTGGKNTSISFGRNFTDTSAAPSSAPSTSTIANEVVKVVKAAGQTFDPNGLYLVFTDRYPSRAGYCAWHSAAKVSISRTTTASFAFGYMPSLLTATTSCGAHYLPGYTPSQLGEGFDSLFNVTTHELYEAMTDSLISGNAWYDAAGYENGDKCAWNWATPLTMNWSGTNYRFVVQQEYSNATHACAA